MRPFVKVVLFLGIPLAKITSEFCPETFSRVHLNNNLTKIWVKIIVFYKKFIFANFRENPVISRVSEKTGLKMRL